MIIGISGKLGSGKDTVANILYNYLGYKYTVILPFAKQLKSLVSLITGYKTDTQEEKNLFLPEYNMTTGEMLQKIGTALRSVNNNIFINMVFNRIKNENDRQYWIIPDVRYFNEAEAIKNAGGLLIRVKGDPIEINKNSTRDKNHSSEIDLDNYQNFDYTINNNGTLSELEFKVNKFITNVLLRA